MDVIDFRLIPVGTLVKRSAHWHKEHCRPKGHYERRQIGVITNLKFFADKIAGVVCYPVIHWEGGVMSSMVHPANVALYRKPKAPLTMVSIDPEAD
jgi:hypothetical protein